jgi:5-methylcytosine-specific restriction protein A
MAGCMPVAPLNTECKEYGCRNKKTGRSSFCLQHGGGISEKGKANARLYNLEAWNSIRARQLSREPLCARCKHEGKITAAQQVDHVFPHNRDVDRFKTNIFQSLCQSCHTLKGQDERKGKYNYYTAHGVIIYYDSDYIRIMRKR